MRQFLLLLLSAFALQSSSQVPSSQSPSLIDQRAALYKHMSETLGYTETEMTALKAVFNGSSVMGQGNPTVTKHPMTREECVQSQGKEGLTGFANADHEKICGDKYMVPLFNPKTGKANDAKACIDMFEFPNIPCEYPVVWTRADEAAAACEAVGKRMCDAHEWEGACEGALTEPDYPFDQVKGLGENAAVKKMRSIHNAKYAASKTWATGTAGYPKGICGGNSSKDGSCNGGDWKRCGSNTYPAGSFPKCKSPLGVYDQHGNAAEHMSLPLQASQMASTGSKDLGVTEMKGSWFIFDKYYAHQDWCRWRAPYWHGTKVKHPKSHHNYHLGFRCCKTISR